MQKKTENLCNVGSITHDGTEETLLSPIRPINGFGRWIYCKYCGKNVKPVLSGVNQIRCSECGYGLTPDFFHIENLQLWMNGKEKEAMFAEEKISKEEQLSVIATMKTYTTLKKAT